MQNPNRMSFERIFTKTPHIVLIIIGLLSCSPRAPAQSGETDVILYVTLNLGNPFYELMIDGMNQEVARVPGLKLEARAGNTTDDATGQRDIIETFLRRDLSGQIRLRGVIIVPANSGLELTSTIRRLNQANIPVINVDLPFNPQALAAANASVKAFIGSNNIDGGRKAADVMAEYLPKGGKLLLLMGAPGQTSAADRTVGFINELQVLKNQRNYGSKVIEWTANWNESEALEATSSLMSGGSHIDGIFAENDLMALGASKAVQRGSAQGESRPVIVGFDAIPEAVQAIKSGTMTASISQSPDQMGRQAVDFLEEIWAGKPVPRLEIIPVKAVTASGN